VARLEVPRHNVDLYVLAGAAGNSLAFGPGYEAASASPGQPGVTVIGGHRDTHFEFLRNIKANTLLSLQLPSGERKAYQVSAMRVVDTRREPYLQLGGDSNELLLVTCYPFDALRPGGPLRYVVTARPVKAEPPGFS
jgi:sortase A